MSGMQGSGAPSELFGGPIFAWAEPILPWRDSRRFLDRKFGYNEIVMQVSIYEARQQLSGLVKRAEQGEEIILTRHHRPVAKLVKAMPTKRVLGGARGQIKEIDPDWWKPMTEEEVEAFYRGDY